MSASVCGWSRQSKLFLILGLLLAVPALWAQTATTGAISGKITDPSGAVVPGATITATNLERGSVKTTQTQADGQYLLPLLEPGTYSVTVAKTGFQTAKQASLTVVVAVNANLPITLQVGATTQTVEVTSAPPLLEPDNPNTHMTLTQTQIENVPNPGGDITALTSLAPGSLIAKGSPSYITGQFNGLPGTDVGYEMDGADDNDSFLNNNASGPTDLLLGQNAISEVSVNTNSYGVDQGRFGAANVSYLSKSGSNAYHGNAQYQWNGRALNAYDFFTKALPLPAGQAIAPKPFDNVNNWAASFGGPIKKNKLFFFFDNEGTRIDLPESLSGTVPTPAFETYALSQLAIGGCDTTGAQNLRSTSPATGASANCEDPQANGNTNYERYLPPETGAGAPSGIDESGFIKHIFSLYGGPQNTTAVGTYGNLEIVPDTNPQTGCPILANGAIDPAFNPQLPYTTTKSASANTANPSGSNPIPADTGCRNSTLLNTSTLSPETLTDFRMDYTANQNNTLWWRFYNDQGIQPSGTSALGNPLLNETSYQPNRQGYFDWTHIFTPTFTNDFHPSFQWYGAVFTMGNDGVSDQNQVLSLLDGLGAFTSPFTSMGSTNFPQGRNVTQYEFIDDLTWTHGSHSFKYGANFRRVDVSDFDVETGANPSSGAGTIQELAYGVASAAAQSFPVLDVQPVRIWQLDLYAGDTWQARKNLTVTYGIRASHNNNVNNPNGDFVNIDDWSQFNHGVGQVTDPLNSVIGTSQQFWSSVPTEQWQPRLSIAYQPDSKTLVKIGWGMFSQVVAADAADNLLALSPAKPSFSTGAGSSTGGYGSAAGCGLNVPQSAQPGILQECYNLLDPAQAFSGVAAARYAYSTFLGNYNGGNPSCAAYSIAGTASPTSCVPVESAGTVYPSTGLPAQYIYQYSFEVQHQFGKNMSLNTGYVGNHANNNAYSVDPNAYESACAGCFAPFTYAGTPGANGAAGTTTLTGCSANNLCDPDPRFSTFNQTEYGGGSRYDSLQTTFTQRLSHGGAYNFNYTWSHCLNTNAPYTLTSGTGDTYRDCTADIRHSINATYSYTLPWHTSNRFLGDLINGWQASGATFFESGSPIFPAGRTGDTAQTSGPTSGAIPVPGENPYDIGQVLTYTAASGTHAAGTTTLTPQAAVQWFNPLSFAGEWDSSTTQCYSPTGVSASSNFQNVGTEGVNPTLCQFPNTYSTTLRGPWFNWTNFYLTKQFKINERFTFRFDAQAYNLFNHNNLGTPSLTGAIFQPGTYNASSNPAGLNSSLIGGGAITSGVSPPTGLLGSGLGGDTNPRMIAFQGKIVF